MTEQIYSKNNPFLAGMKENRQLNTPGSGKDTRHVVLDIEGSGIDYRPGDSLCVLAKNSPAMVEEFLKKLELDGSTEISRPDGSVLSLQETLSSKYTLNRANKKFTKAVAERSDGSPISTMTEEELGEYIFSRDYIDILNEHPKAKFSAEELPELLTRIVPRLYSVASSCKKHPGEAHVTLAVVAYSTHGRDKWGLASGYLAKHVPIGEKVPVFIHHNKKFCLPEDSNANIIMVGPGTGIAPFRAFLQEREMKGDQGKNWLFFGDRKRASDFLYEDELEEWQKKGVLARVDTAFSRDQDYKIYVQDRVRENSAEIWRWLQDGAYFYVCGDKRMGKDVHQALIDVAQKEGKMEPNAAEEYLQSLKTEKRYRRDVY